MTLRTGILNPLGNVYTVDWVDYSGSSTIIGWQVAGRTEKIYYKKIGKLVFVAFNISGTSDSASVSFTVPFTNSVVPIQGALGQCSDAGSDITTACLYSLNASSSTVSCYKNMVNAAWTGSGAKSVVGNFWYIIT
jgi:hypothetical protein